MGLSITLISFIFFYANKLPYTSVFDPIAYKEYMTYWDDHRTGYGKLGVMENGYIFKSVFLFLLIIFFLKLNYLKENWGLKLSLQTLAFSIFFFFMFICVLSFFF